jgi:hypothetical protein
LRVGQKLQVRLHVIGGIGEEPQFSGKQRGVEPALRPRRVRLDSEFVVVEGLVRFLSLDGVFGCQSEDQQRLMGAAAVYIFTAMPSQSVPGIFTSPARRGPAR